MHELSLDSILPLDDNMGWCDFMLLQVNKNKGEFEGFSFFYFFFFGRFLIFKNRNFHIKKSKNFYTKYTGSVL